MIRSLRKPRLQLVLVVALSCCTNASLQADLVLTGAEHTGGSSFPDGSTSESRGYRFRPEVDIIVTGLGLFDVYDDGIPGANGYNVRLWDDSGSQIAIANVPSGTGAPLVDGFRTVPLASTVNLAAGTIYTVSADFGDNLVAGEFLIGPIELTVNPNITIMNNSSDVPSSLDGDWLLFGASGVLPTTALSFEHLGPNVVFTVVPEPSSFLFLGLAACVGIGYRGKKE